MLTRIHRPSLPCLSVQNSRTLTVSVSRPARLRWLPKRSVDVVAELGFDPDGDAVGGLVAVVAQADVLDGRLADDLDVVVPAAAVHVVEPALPLDEQVGPDEPAERRSVAAVPRGLDLLEQRGGVGFDHVGSERLVLLGGHRGGRLDATPALGDAPAGLRSAAAAGRPGAVARAA